MAHESFEDARIAEVLNAHYICIKVDREERPDLDTIYMNYCQVMTGGGGWPLNLFLTPDQVPIYAGTYFPTFDMQGRPGFMTVITHLHKLWTEDKETLLDKSRSIQAYVNNGLETKPEQLPSFVTVEAYRDLEKRFDHQYGGFGGAPKFPTPHQLMYLLMYWERKGEQDALEMVTKTLDSMYAGGIYDHIGGGFARYSVDEKWLVPHFEKMLYDNALLIRTYSQAYAATKKPLYKDIAYQIYEFLRREMRSQEGGYYTAFDADSEGVEGRYYVFDKKEIIDVLKDRAPEFCRMYDISETGNFEGDNIPNLIGKDVSHDIFEGYSDDRQTLLAYREGRVKPGLDHKILTSCNSMLLTGLTVMSMVFEDDMILSEAVDLEAYISANLWKSDRLYGSKTSNQLGNQAVLDDYAFYMEGLLWLHKATLKSNYLKKALVIQEKLDSEFKDTKNGGYFMTSSQHETLISRPKECYDGAIPSGNSVLAMTLLLLSRLTDSQMMEKDVTGLLKSFGKKVAKGPSYFTYMMKSQLLMETGTKDLVIALPSDVTEKEIPKKERYQFIQFDTVILSKEVGYPAVDEKITYYVCENFTCSFPKFTLI